MPSKIDTERVTGYLNELLEKIQAQADPDMLNQYRSLIKKRVSFFRRSYLTAYLLMELERKTGNAGSGQRGNRPRKAPSASSLPEEAPRFEPRTYLSPEESARLFISAGRSRRVFPRELLNLIIANTTASKDDVGTIRILDGYSFVQVRASRADEIIAALDRSSFRGRPITVNYARGRKEGGAEEPEQDEAKPPVPEQTVAPQIEAEPSSAEQPDDHDKEEGV